MTEWITAIAVTVAAITGVLHMRHVTGSQRPIVEAHPQATAMADGSTHCRVRIANVSDRTLCCSALYLRGLGTRDGRIAIMAMQPNGAGGRRPDTGGLPKDATRRAPLEITVQPRDQIWVDVALDAAPPSSITLSSGWLDGSPIWWW